MEETRKDKREDSGNGVLREEDIVKATWGTMSAGKKIEYLWM